MTWLSYQDGDKFYIQNDPKSEGSISCFDSMKQADEFCEFLNKKGDKK